MNLAPDQNYSPQVQSSVDLYRSLGLAPFPVCKPRGKGCVQHGNCAHPGKVPLLKGWERLDPERADQAKAIDAIFERWGWQCNVGLRTGKSVNLYVLDLDGSKDDVEAAGYELPDTVVVRTGRTGGYHYWLAPGEEELKKKISLVRKTDFIAEGGYVLAPPSVHASGNTYTFANDGVFGLLDGAKLASVPAWILEGKGLAPVVDLPLANDDEVGIGQRAREFLRNGADFAQRDEAVNAVVNLLGRGMDRDEVVRRVAYALTELSPQTNPTWPWKTEDVENMVESFERQGGVHAAKGLSAPVLTLDDDDEDSEPQQAGKTVRDIFDALVESDEVELPLVEGILWPGKCHVIYADSGTGKTLFTLEMLLHMAAGRAYHGRQVKPTKTMLVEIDDTHQLRDYMETMRDTYQFTREELGGRFVTNNEDDTDFSLRDKASRIALQSFVAEHEPQVVVLDALEMFLAGNGEYGAAVYKHLRDFKDWCKNRGIALWVIDHAKKGWRPGDESGVLNPHHEALAGGQQKLAIFDVAFHMWGSLSDDTVLIYYAKMRDQKPDPIHWTFGADGSTLKAAVTEKSIFDGMSPKEIKVLEYIINQGPVEMEKVLIGTGVSKATFNRLLQARFLPRGLVRRNGGGVGAGRGNKTTYQAGPHYTAPKSNPTLTLDDEGF